MKTKAFQKIYTKIENITKATCTIKAEGVTNEEMAYVDGRPAQVVKINRGNITLQIFPGTQGVATNAEVVFTGKPPTIKVSDELRGRFFNAYGDPIDDGPAVEGEEREMLPLFRPGYRKPSYSRAFLSVFNTGPFEMDCNRHGGLRACIACNHCTAVCPVDILPQLTYKSILAEEIEEALAHGLLDCVECGLCSYVCPSKIELYQVLKNAKAAYSKEQA